MNKPCPHHFAFASAKLILALGLAALCFLLLPGNLKAQTTISGDIAGTVTDASGAAIPGATINIKNTDTGSTSTVTTSGAGQFRANLLKPGTYTIDASAPNFQTSQTTTVVAVGQTATVNLTLAVAKGMQTVEVQGTVVPLLQPENADIATTISMQTVQNLPNPGGDITYYINLTQGVVMNTQGGYGNSSAFGLPATSNNFTVNGAQDNDPFLNLNNSGPSNLLLGSNDIDEVNIVANAFSAQYGGLGGVQENVLSRSGSNRFHGNATYWWTNSDLNANDWFNDFSGTAQPYSNANQWAAAVGGPIVKDKAFFFVNYEGLHFVTSPADFVTIPSPAYQAALLTFINSPTIPNNPIYANACPNPALPNGDPSCAGSPNAGYNPAETAFYQKMFNLYNSAPGAASSQPYLSATDANTGLVYANYFEANPRNNLAENLVTARYDQKLGPNDGMFIHFKWDHGVQPTYVDPIDPAFNAQSDQPDYEGQLEETHTFSPNVVNQFLLAGAWYSAYFLSVNQAQATATFPYTLDVADGSFVSNGNGTSLGGIGYAWPEGRDVTQYQVNDDLSWTKGKHTLSFGGIFKRNDVTDADLGVLSTPLAIQLGPAEGTFSPYDFFGNGYMYLGIQNFPNRSSEPIALYNLGFYAQDQWKVSPNLQFNYGLRVEHNSNPVCVTNCFARFTNSYNAVNGGLDSPYNQTLVSGLTNAFTHLQAMTYNPRIGLTFSPPDHPNTLFRGGFGLFSDIFPATVADDLLNNAPLNPQFSAAGYLADPAQPGSFTAATAATNEAFKAGYASGGSYNSIYAADPNFTVPNVYNVDQKIHYPTYEEWSAQWQQQVGRNTSFQIGYVGNHGYHEPLINNGVNASQAGSAITFAGLPANPALPAYGEVQEIQSTASSNYNGLIATVKGQSKVFTYMVNYTWSHALDMISNGGFLPFGGNTYAPVNPFNLASQNYGNADYDIRHNLNGNYLIHVPYFGGPKVLTDGWMVGGTLFWHTGFPFSVTSSSATEALDATGAYGGTALAVVTNPNVPHNCGRSFITTSCFGTNPGQYFADPTSFAGQSRNQFFGPGYFNTDFSVTKSFKIPITDTGRFEVGAQAYNVLNHPDFANPVFDSDSPGFGTVQSTVSVPTSVYGSFLGGDASPRILQIKAKIEF